MAARVSPRNQIDPAFPQHWRATTAVCNVACTAIGWTAEVDARASVISSTMPDDTGGDIERRRGGL